jgi:hypothetical protein
VCELVFFSVWSSCRRNISCRVCSLKLITEVWLRFTSMHYLGVSSIGCGPQEPQIYWHRHMKVVGCQPYAPAAFTLRINLVLSFRGWVDPRAHGTVRWYGKNPGDTGNLSRDLSTYSAVHTENNYSQRVLHFGAVLCWTIASKLAAVQPLISASLLVHKLNK